MLRGAEVKVLVTQFLAVAGLRNHDPNFVALCRTRNQAIDRINEELVLDDVDVMELDLFGCVKLDFFKYGFDYAYVGEEMKRQPIEIEI